MVWIVLGIAGVSLLGLGWAVVVTAGSVRALLDVLRTIEVRAKSAGDLQPGLVELRARLDELQQPLEGVQEKAVVLQERSWHQPAS